MPTGELILKDYDTTERFDSTIRDWYIGVLADMPETHLTIYNDAASGDLLLAMSKVVVGENGEIIL